MLPLAAPTAGPFLKFGFGPRAMRLLPTTRLPRAPPLAPRRSCALGPFAKQRLVPLRRSGSGPFHVT